jgi:hypothetical protein
MTPSRKSSLFEHHDKFVLSYRVFSSVFLPDFEMLVEVIGSAFEIGMELAVFI